MTGPVGADREYAAVGALVGCAAQGAGRALAVLGPAGTGKSRLLGRAVRDAQAAGLTVLTATASELEEDRALGVVADLLRVDRRSLLDRAEDVHAVVDDALDALEQRALAAPLLLCVDDAHWADEESVRVLHRAARAVTLLGVGLLVGSRPSSRRDVAALLDATDAVVLRELQPAEVGRFLEEHLGKPAGPRLRRQAEVAGGNPLLLRELVDGLRRGEELHDDGEEVDATSELPSTLSASVRARVQRLPQPAAAVARTASVLGTRFAAAELADAVGLGTADLLPMLEVLRDERLLELDGGEPRFRHDLVRDAVYADLPPSVAHELHVTAAWALAERGAAPEVVASHLRIGARAGDRRALDWLRRTADGAAATAPARAVDLLDRAAELLPEGAERDEVTAECLMPLVWAGRPAEAEQRGRQLLARRLPDGEQVRVRAALAAAGHLQGRRADVLEHLRAGESAARTAHEVAALRRLRAEALEAEVLAGDLHAGERLARELAVEAAAARDDVAECLAESAVAHALLVRGAVLPSLEAARRAVAAGDRTPASQRRNKRHVLGVLLVHADRLDEAEAVLRLGLAENERLGVTWSSPSLQFFLAVTLAARGLLADALTHCEAALAIAADSGTRVNVVDAQHQRVTLLAQLGRDQEAWAYAEELTAAGAVGIRALPRLLLLHRAGRIDEVRAALDAPVLDGPRLAPFRVFGVQLVKLMLAAGLREQAEQVAERVQRLADVAAVPGARAAALRCRGLLDGDVAASAEAVELLGHVGRRTERAEALEEAGRVAEAAAEYAALGMLHDVRRLGARTADRRRPRPATGWDALTESERRVVDLVGEGLTYREVGERLFISRRTVETHVAHVFQKLGISSRRELAVLVGRRT